MPEAFVTACTVSPANAWLLCSRCLVQREWVPGAGAWHSVAKVNTCCFLEAPVNVLKASWNMSAHARGAKTRVLGQKQGHRLSQTAPQRADRNARIQGLKSVSKVLLIKPVIQGI